jgi:hypothetical protein
MHEYEQGALFDYEGKADVLTAKPVLLSLCSLQIQHGLKSTRDLRGEKPALQISIMVKYHICSSLS